MNVSNFTLHHLALWLLILFSPLLANAQGYQHYEVVQGEVFEYSFFSQYAPNPVPTANHGTIEMISMPPNSQGMVEYVLQYTPNPGHIGLDYTDFVYAEFLSPIHVYLEIETVGNKVEARNDYLSIRKNTNGTLNVLENDYSNTGNLYLVSLPLANNCQLAQDDDGTITVIPDPDFTGVARFQYSVCNEEGLCDVGTATIFVEKETATIDTLYLTTKRNRTIDVLIPTSGGYNMINNPDHGYMEASDPAGILTYTPNENSSSTSDQFQCYYVVDGVFSIRTYFVSLLDAEEVNNFALDDHAFTPLNTPVTVAVLENDLGADLDLINFTSPLNGSVEVANNQVIYTPDEDYEGYDKFTYNVCVQNTSSCETATIMVGVSDQAPTAVATYKLTTAINTPLVIKYDISIDAWEFIVTNGGSTAIEGNVEYFAGDYDGDNILDQAVEGYNLLVYTPPTDITGNDEFEVQYCTENACELVKIRIDIIEPPTEEEPLCVNDCVWSGDANFDGQVDMSDLLPIGYCVGEMGDYRPNGSIDWYAQYGADWNGTIGATGKNIKHVDTDGDGFVTAADTAAILAAYGKRHTLTPKAIPALSNVPLFFVPLTSNPQPGDLVEIEVVLGTAQIPATNINGITFSLNYNASIVKPGSMNVQFYQGNWMGYDAPTLSLVKHPFEGRLDAGYTRTGGLSGDGFGVIGKIDFIIEDVIDGIRPGDSLRVSLDNAYAPTAMNGSGEVTQLVSYDPTLFIKFEEEKEETIEDLVIAYPNPAQDVLNIHANGEQLLRQVSMYTTTGQQVYDSGQLGEEVSHHQINVSKMLNTMYLVKVMTNEGLVTKKVQVMKEER